ncbi:MAG: 6-phosphofructokinase [Lachnospiraceae bacterium]|nr:6-phosphofructokinase [Lachnospiraceae bacterium]
MNCMVAQSGGPTVAINASLAGVLEMNRKTNHFSIVYGAINGISGVLEERFLNLSEKMENDASFTKRLSHSPAMYLGSCRYKLPKGDEGQEKYQEIFKVFEKLEIDTFFYIGGNDSMDTVDKLSQYAKAHALPVKIIGIPKTIDNDLVKIDHTPGFGSAAKYVAASVREVAMDAYIYAVKSVTIVEIMGRDAGWLTAASALARTKHSPAPDLIYLPEVPFDLDKCIQDTRSLLEGKNTVVIAMSEGIRDKNGDYISTADSASDIFGHNHLSGAGKTLEGLLKNALQVKVRSIEINVLQRAAAHMASETDLMESELLGENAFSLAMEGKTGLMSILTRESSNPYKVAYSSWPVSEIANQVKSVPREWINEDGNDVTKEMVDYLNPLIQGEPDVPYVDGLPDYLPVEHLYPNR